MKVVRYNSTLKEEWNRFIGSSRNGTFLLERDYMDYHADRFTDHSLLFYTPDGKLIALLPGNEREEIYYSHQGLTYGGFIFSEHLHTVQMLEVMELFLSYLRERDFQKVIYKAIPAIYHRHPAEEDLYALFRAGAQLMSRGISSTIRIADALPFNQNRKRGVKRALKAGLTIAETTDFAPFWNILQQNLQERYHTNPVHSLDEITKLAQSFPDNIRCYQVANEGEVLGGVVMYVTDRVAHVQYISSSEAGKKVGALDMLFDYLIHEVYADTCWFDFGISTEDGGTYLNEGLIRQKEGFGARGIVYDTYQIDLKA